MNTDQPAEQRLLEAVIRVERMGTDIHEIKSSIKEMALAITRLAIFEERQITDRLELVRTSSRLDSQDDRIAKLELAQPLQQQTTDIASKIYWLIFGAVLSAVVSIAMGVRSQEVSSRVIVKVPQQESTR